MQKLEQFRGCLLGGAVGDALGAVVEFDDLERIRQRFGDHMSLDALRVARFTDDTQMTLFTAEGLIRAHVRMGEKGITSVVEVTYHAYQRWLQTQGETPRVESRFLDGWLITNQVLHRRAAPGNTCLSALRSGRKGTVDDRINTSKGCGGVMRAAPVGLFISDIEQSFQVGCDIAAITHGHPSGYLPAGALAVMVTQLIAGHDLRHSVDSAMQLLRTQPESDETVAALTLGIELADLGRPTAEDLQKLGGGWVGEEALAIAVACALVAEDLPSALSLAVVHSGDSDSTGAICGNLLGAHWGVEAIPAPWLRVLEGVDLVDQVARDLWTERVAPPTEGAYGGASKAWWHRYPGY